VLFEFDAFYLKPFFTCVRCCVAKILDKASKTNIDTIEGYENFVDYVIEVLYNDYYNVVV
jgi:hypothetical protein